MKVRQKRSRDTGAVIERPRKDGSVAYMLKWRAYTRTTAAASRKEAMALLPVFIAEVQSGEIERQREAERQRAEMATLSKWSERFLELHVGADPDRAATKKTYTQRLRLYILPALGHNKLADITSAMVREMAHAMLAKGLSRATIKLTMATLHRCLDAAMDDGLVTSNPVPAFKKLKLGDIASASEGAKRSALTGGQVAALLDACDSPELRLYVSLLAATGMRPGEALGLTWANVDHAQGVVHIECAAKRIAGDGFKFHVWRGKPKTASSVRVIAVGPSLLTMLKAERSRQEAFQAEMRGLDPKVARLKPLLPAEACIFPGDPFTPEGLLIPTDPSAMRSRFTRIAKRAGVKATAHYLRHTAISHAIEAGLGLADVAARAGHSNVATTARTYVHSVSASQRQAGLIGDTLLSASAGDVEQIGNQPAASSDAS